MFGIPAWLFNLIFTLVVKIGLPFVQKILPTIPAEVWAAIKELLSHFHKTDMTDDEKVEKVDKLRVAVNGITKAKKRV